MESMNLNEEQKKKFKELRDDKYGKAFFGMVGNRHMEYEINATTKTYEECMKTALDQEILNDITRDMIKNEKTKIVIGTTSNTEKKSFI